MNRFESVKEIQNAPLEDLEAIPGFPKELAEKLYETFHPEKA